MKSVRVPHSELSLDSIGDPDGELSRTRILVVDDNTEILDRICDVIQPEYEVIGKVADGDMVCGEVASLRPDLVVLDISLGERSGIEIAQSLHDQGFAGEIVFLTVHEDPDIVTAAIGAGARGYVTKSRVVVDLGRAIKAALAHHIFISASLRPE